MSHPFNGIGDWMLEPPPEDECSYCASAEREHEALAAEIAERDRAIDRLRDDVNDWREWARALCAELGIEPGYTSAVLRDIVAGCARASEPGERFAALVAALGKLEQRFDNAQGDLPW